MLSNQDRIKIIQQIDAIIDGDCADCSTKARIMATCPADIKPGTYAMNYCTKQCPAGLQLQALGKQLGNADRYSPDDQITYRRKHAHHQDKKVYA